jgi:hypothetical protein
LDRDRVEQTARGASDELFLSEHPLDRERPLQDLPQPSLARRIHQDDHRFDSGEPI